MPARIGRTGGISAGFWDLIDPNGKRWKHFVFENIQLNEIHFIWLHWIKVQWMCVTIRNSVLVLVLVLSLSFSVSILNSFHVIFVWLKIYSPFRWNFGTKYCRRTKRHILRTRTGCAIITVGFTFSQEKRAIFIWIEKLFLRCVFQFPWSNGRHKCKMQKYFSHLAKNSAFYLAEKK